MAKRTEQQQYLRMTETPVARLVTSLALPTVGGMLVSSIYNITDTFFVSQLGTSASAAVGVVFSGSGSVREHVQRLGRILRPSPGKNQAMLYELVSAGTSEEYTSGRRREHQAYRQRR